MGLSRSASRNSATLPGRPDHVVVVVFQRYNIKKKIII
jgi:hypothetical protein